MAVTKLGCGSSTRISGRLNLCGFACQMCQTVTSKDHSLCPACLPLFISTTTVRSTILLLLSLEWIDGTSQMSVLLGDFANVEMDRNINKSLVGSRYTYMHMWLSYSSLKSKHYLCFPLWPSLLIRNSYEFWLDLSGVGEASEWVSESLDPEVSLLLWIY